MAAIGEQDSITKRLTDIKQAIVHRANEIGRDPQEIKLVVVTKEKTALVVKQLAELGHHMIGESYLKEAAFKMDLLREYDLDWHMIGNIQKGKERQIARRFDVIHSIDRVDVATKINQEANRIDKRIPIFLEFNVSGETTKHGFAAWDEKRWVKLTEEISDIFQLKYLPVLGLMTMAPYFENPEKARPYFIKMRKLRDFLQGKFPDQNLVELSMGMSGDYLVAIEEGATYLRIGSAIVGMRERDG